MPLPSFILVAAMAGAMLSLSACSERAGSSGSDGRDGASGAVSATDFSALKDFQGVASVGPDTVAVTVGRPFSVKAEGDARTLQALEVGVVDGELRIGRKEGWDRLWSGSDKGATIHVSLPALAGARLTGSGDVSIDRAEGAELVLSLTGSGNMTLGAARIARLTADVTGSGGMRIAGSADRATLSTTGSGDIEGKGFKAANASVSVLGSGDVDFASDGAVDIRIMGSGDVDVKGRARCKVQAMGSGEARCSA